MAQRKRNHPNRAGHRAATGLVAAGNPLALHSVETLTRQRLGLGSPPGAAAELHLRAAHGAADAPRDRHAAVRQGRGGARRPHGPGHSLRDARHRRAVGDPAAGVRPGALPCPHSDDPGRTDASRPVPVRVLRWQSRHRRPRGAAQPRRPTHLGELRRRAVRPATTARPTSCCRSWDGPCGCRRCHRRANTGGCCRRSRNSTRPGSDIWAKARREVTAPGGDR